MHEVVRRRFARYLEERSRPASSTTPTPTSRASRPGERPGIDPETGRPAPLRLPAAARGRRRRPAAGRRRPARPRRARHRRRRARRARQAARGGLAARRGGPGPPARAPARGSTCCSACATRRTASRSPTTGRSAARAWSSPRSTASPGSGRPAARRCCDTSGRSSGCKAATVEEVMEVPGIGRRTAEAVLAALAARGAPRSRRRRPRVRPRHRRGGRVSAPSPRQRRPPTAELVVVTGLSGAGRSTAAKCLEDLGWFVVDNLPPSLLPTMVDLGTRSQGAVGKIAVVVDVRSRAFSSDLRTALDELVAATACTPRVLFLEAERRRAGPPLRERPPAAPAAGRGPPGRRDRPRARAAARAARLGRPRARHQPAQRPRAARQGHRRVRRGRTTPRRCSSRCCRSATSTACRSTPTSSSTAASCPTRTGSPSCARTPARTPPVRDYVLAPARRGGVPRPLRGRCCGCVTDGYAREGKRYALLAVGCTGGKHRSVAMSEQLAARLARARAASTCRSSTATWGASERRRPADGRPQVVALGGGHGLAASLQALRQVTPHLTAVVTVADDGGSSGRLRDELGALPPGDLRMALAALAGARRLGPHLGATCCSTGSPATARWPATPSATCCSPG